MMTIFDDDYILDRRENFSFAKQSCFLVLALPLLVCRSVSLHPGMDWGLEQPSGEFHWNLEIFDNMKNI